MFLCLPCLLSKTTLKLSDRERGEKGVEGRCLKEEENKDNREGDRWTSSVEHWAPQQAQLAVPLLYWTLKEWTRCSSFRLGCVTNSFVRTTGRGWSGSHRQHFWHYLLLSNLYSVHSYKSSVLSLCDFSQCFSELWSHFEVPLRFSL